MVGMELLKTVDDPFLNHVKLLRHSEPTQIVKYPIVMFKQLCTKKVNVTEQNGRISRVCSLYLESPALLGPR